MVHCGGHNQFYGTSKPEKGNHLTLPNYALCFSSSLYSDSFWPQPRCKLNRTRRFLERCRYSELSLRSTIWDLYGSTCSLSSQEWCCIFPICGSVDVQNLLKSIRHTLSPTTTLAMWAVWRHESWLSSVTGCMYLCCLWCIVSPIDSQQSGSMNAIQIHRQYNSGFEYVDIYMTFNI